MSRWKHSFNNVDGCASADSGEAGKMSLTMIKKLLKSYCFRINK